ncbi:MAG TPA: PIG-L deacetylase family protein [Acidimicrobiales bacterium]|nr:PIG-L deacetylase family protein [Acidimicrobiales bacterium]
MTAEVAAGVPERALAVYAHPDDADVSCGGTLARWADAGCEVHVVLCALGDKGSLDPLTDPAALVATRAAEVEAARRVLGITSVLQLGRRDGELENDLSLRAELVGAIRELRPQVLVCPDPLAVFFGEHYYNHRDHRVVGFAALDAASPAAASPLYFPGAGTSFAVEVAYLSGSLEPTVYVDVTATIERKAEAVLCHRSQLGETGEHFRDVVRERAEEAGSVAGVRFAEGFRRIHLGR